MGIAVHRKELDMMSRLERNCSFSDIPRPPPLLVVFLFVFVKEFYEVAHWKLFMEWK